METITKFRDEEQEHHDIGLEHDAEQERAWLAGVGVPIRRCSYLMHHAVRSQTQALILNQLILEFEI